jgi:hypothetical protein
LQALFVPPFVNHILSHHLLKNVFRFDVVLHRLVQFRVAFGVFARDQGGATEKVVVIVRHASTPMVG